MYPEFQRTILQILICGDFLFSFVVGGTQFQCSLGDHISLQKKSSLYVSLLANFSLCESSLCCQVNFFPVLDQIPGCLLKLILQICCEWSCQQVELYKVRLVLQQPRVLVAHCLPSSLVILNSFFFFSFLLGVDITMTTV